MRRVGSFALVIGLAISVLTVAPANGAPPSPVTSAAPGAFTAVPPARVLDTRSGAGPVGPARSVTLDLSARVPASTTAVVLNVTGTAPTAATFVTVYPAGAGRPDASNLNLVAGETRPNLVTVAVGTDRKVVLYNNIGSVHLIADLAGYYATDPAAATGRFSALMPDGVLDTRKPFGSRPPGPVGDGGVETLDLSDLVPDSATAVTLTLTGTGATTGTFVTAWPTGTPRPTVSNLNLTAGATATNQVVVALGADRKVSLYNENGRTHLIVDAGGFYTPDYGALFTPVTPKRVLDTRNGAGPISRGGQITLGLTSTVPPNTTGVVLNLTGTQGTANTFITAWPPPEIRPIASHLNLARGRTAASLATVGVGTGASVSFYNEEGTTHLIADLAGYFSVPPVACAGNCVLAWGSNDSGALGTGGYDPSSVAPALVYGLSDVTAISGGAHTSYALKADGTVWAWGDNVTGRLGNGWRGSKSVVPVPVAGLDDVIAIDGSIAVKSDGTVWDWGQIGWSLEPARVPELTDVIAVAAGANVAYALKSDGTVWAWGSNQLGALGNGVWEGYYTREPVQVSGLTGVRQIADAAYGGLALKSDGTLWSWGDNRRGRLGHGTVAENTCYIHPPTEPNCFAGVPAQVLGLTGVTAIDADGTHGFAVLGDGTAWAWGSNYHGGLGNGVDCDTCATGTPVRIAGLTTAKAIAANWDGGYVLDAGGRVWAWGDNERAALGDVETTPPGPYSTVPLRLREPTGVTAITGALDSGFALVP
jgi:alpha-tubulin suppressor-like RCC1 family protein